MLWKQQDYSQVWCYGYIGFIRKVAFEVQKGHGIRPANLELGSISSFYTVILVRPGTKIFFGLLVLFTPVVLHFCQSDISKLFYVLSFLL